MNRSPLQDRDGFWWAISLTLGIAAGLVSRVIISTFGGSEMWLVFRSMVAPGFLGYCRPERPWRWAFGFFLGLQLVELASLDTWTNLAWVFIFGSLPAALMLLAAYLGSYLRQSSRSGTEDDPDIGPAKSVTGRFGRVFVWAIVWGSVLGGVGLVAGLFGGLTHQDSNMAPILGFFLGPPAFVVGLVAGALVSLIQRLTDRQIAFLLAGVALAFAIVVVGFMATTSGAQDVSEIPDAAVRSQGPDSSNSDS